MVIYWSLGIFDRVLFEKDGVEGSSSDDLGIGIQMMDGGESR